MKKSLHETLERMVSDETQYCSSGKFDFELTPENSAFEAAYRDGDWRKAEAICDMTNVHPLEVARTKMMRGDHASSSDILTALGSAPVSVMMDVELSLEMARLAAFQGDWNQALENAIRGLSLDPSNITKISLLQVKSAALFELGRFAESLTDIELVISYSTLLPNSPAATYARAYRARIRARQVGFLAGLLELDEIWSECIREGKTNAHFLLVLIKAEIDIRRLQGKNHSELAIVSYHLARASGDELYAGLALVEYYFSKRTLVSDLVVKELNLVALKFPRVASLLHEVTHSKNGSSAAKSIQRFLTLGDSLPVEDHEILLFKKPQKIFFLSKAVVVTLSPFSLTQIDLTDQNMRALVALSRGAIEKDIFFKIVWEGQKYVSDLHDGVIKSFVGRLRGKLKTTIINRHKKIDMPDGFVIQSGAEIDN